ncbi:hypothetical protein VSR68_20285 [Paraburkholderia phymatum]|uniref:hypothetical protein n=1 Tax=Paraburkholderia phymatum TaxID=148447 RepID=UPI003172CE3B
MAAYPGVMRLPLAPEDMPCRGSPYCRVADGARKRKTPLPHKSRDMPDVTFGQVSRIHSSLRGFATIARTDLRRAELPLDVAQQNGHRWARVMVALCWMAAHCITASTKLCNAGSRAPCLW